MYVALQIAQLSRPYGTYKATFQILAQTKSYDCAEPLMDLSRIPTNNGTESRLGWTEIQQMYENVHPNLALAGAIVRTRRSGMPERSIGFHRAINHKAFHKHDCYFDHKELYQE